MDTLLKIINPADIIIIIMVALFCLLGLKKGFIKSSVGLLSLAASMLLAWILYPVLSDLLKNVGVNEALESFLSGKIGQKTTEAITSLGIPDFLKGFAQSAGDTAATSTAKPIAGIIVSIVSFVGVLILSRIIIFIVSKFLNVVSKLPVVNGFNRFLGLLVGFLKGVLIVYVLLAVMVAFLPSMPQKVSDSVVKESYIAKNLIVSNPILKGIISDSIDEAEEVKND